MVSKRSADLQLCIIAHGEPRFSVGIILVLEVSRGGYMIIDIAYLLPVCEYTLTDPSCIATAQNDGDAVKATTGDGR